MTKALVVLSGGQDSTTCLFWAKREFDDIFALTFDYGQRHRREIEAARTIAQMAQVKEHEVLSIPEILIGSSPLVSNEPLETYDSYDKMSAIIGDRTELTFVPLRNALFLTIAANRAAVKGISHIVTGVCEEDNANYPDCRQEFIENMELAINSALGRTVWRRLSEKSCPRILTPVINKTKAESIALAKTLDGCMEALAYSHTAYSGEYPPLTQDHATVLRAQGFLEANEPDPLIVRAWREGRMALPSTPNYIGVTK